MVLTVEFNLIVVKIPFNCLGSVGDMCFDGGEWLNSVETCGKKLCRSGRELGVNNHVLLSQTTVSGAWCVTTHSVGEQWWHMII